MGDGIHTVAYGQDAGRTKVEDEAPADEQDGAGEATQQDGEVVEGDPPEVTAI